MNQNTQRQTDFSPLALEQFLFELTELSRKHGIAVSDTPHLYLMDWDDHANNYACDDESRLIIA